MRALVFWFSTTNPVLYRKVLTRSIISHFHCMRACVCLCICFFLQGRRLLGLKSLWRWVGCCVGACILWPGAAPMLSGAVAGHAAQHHCGVAAQHHCGVAIVETCQNANSGMYHVSIAEFCGKKKVSGGGKIPLLWVIQAKPAGRSSHCLQSCLLRRCIDACIFVRPFSAL